MGSTLVCMVSHSRAAVVLDVNETLFSLDGLNPVFEQTGLAGMRDLWFTRTLRNGFALTCAGRYRSFPDVARAAFVSLDPERLTAKDADPLMDAFAQLRPHPEVPAALTALQESGVAAVTLSVGNAANVAALFDGAGMAGLIEQHLSCETVQRWKPAAQPYLHACEVLDRQPRSVWMVAAHAWDLTGAKAIGMKTAWLARLEGALDENFEVPDVQGSDLRDVVGDIINR